jgi:hypothetical protein
LRGKVNEPISSTYQIELLESRDCNEKGAASNLTASEGTKRKANKTFRTDVPEN